MSSAVDPHAARRRLEEEILRVLRSLQYGTLTITVHDSRIVQIERAEKIRVAESKTSAAARGTAPADLGQASHETHSTAGRLDDRSPGAVEDPSSCEAERD